MVTTCGTRWGNCPYPPTGQATKTLANKPVLVSKTICNDEGFILDYSKLDQNTFQHNIKCIYKRLVNDYKPIFDIYNIFVIVYGLLDR